MLQLLGRHRGDQLCECLIEILFSDLDKDFVRLCEVIEVVLGGDGSWECRGLVLIDDSYVRETIMDPSDSELALDCEKERNGQRVMLQTLQIDS